MHPCFEYLGSTLYSTACNTGNIESLHDYKKNCDRDSYKHSACTEYCKVFITRLLLKHSVKTKSYSVGVGVIFHEVTYEYIVCPRSEECCQSRVNDNGL